MRAFILFTVIFFTVLGTQAHSVDTSTMMLVEQEDHTWNLQIRSSLNSFRAEVKTHFAETPYQTPEQFREQLLEYFCNSLKITIDDNQSIPLEYGSVKLGHETVLFFNQIKLPNDFNTIKVVGDVFKDIYKSKMKLIVVKDGFKSNPVTLDQKNNYTATLATQEKSFVLVTDKKIDFSLTYSIIIPALLIGLFIIIIRLNKSKPIKLQFNA